jgi:CRP/FNR family transcriptional regulator, polysaccharide utilization system transcription regulator
VNTYAGLTMGEVFDGLMPDTLKDFQSLGHSVSHPPGTILFAAGEACTGVFCVSSGEVSVSAYDDYGRCLISHVARPGELLGLKAALCGEAYGITARTESPSEVIFVSRDHLSAFLSSHADAAFRIVQRLSERLGIALDQLRSASTVNLPKPPN